MREACSPHAAESRPGVVDRELAFDLGTCLLGVGVKKHKLHAFLDIAAQSPISPIEDAHSE
jgi:hypothetical protein